MPVLTASHGDRVAGRFEWASGAITIGRGPDNDIDLSSLDDLSISRSHARIQPVGEGYEVCDIGAKNAVLVNGRLVSRQRLADGDQIQVGDVVLVFELRPAGAAPARPVGDTASRARDGHAAEGEADGLQTIGARRDYQAADVEVLRDSHRRLLRLYELARRFHAAANVRELLAEIVSALCEVTPAERAFAALFGRDIHDVKLAVCRNMLVSNDQKRWPVSTTLLKRVIEQGQPVVSDNATADPHFSQIESVRRLQIRSVMCAPLVQGSQAVGVVYADSEARTGAFREHDVDLMRALSLHAAAALSAAALRESLAAENLQLQRENARLTQRRASGIDIVGESGAIRAVLDKAHELAAIGKDAPVSVLLLGETGTGKELVAREIHGSSPRARGPFVPVNCAAIPDNLVESELFGIEPGVATGVSARSGKFELAEGGTIFLDEIADLSVLAQAKILRVLQDKTITRVGGRTQTRVDVWIMAATNKDLGKQVEAGHFRDDLYYRLRVVELTIPPLRERGDDVERLALYFLDRYSRSLGKSVREITPAGVSALAGYAWPGNVRELENCIAGSVAFCRGVSLGVSDLPVQVRGPRSSQASDLVSLDEMERRHLERALEHTGWNITKTAAILGIGRQAVYQKISKHGLTKPDE